MTIRARATDTHLRAGFTNPRAMGTNPRATAAAERAARDAAREARNRRRAAWSIIDTAAHVAGLHAVTPAPIDTVKGHLDAMRAALHNR